MPLKDYQTRAIKKYHEANYDFIKVRLLKGEKEKLKAEAEKEGKSLNQYIRDRIITFEEDADWKKKRFY